MYAGLICTCHQPLNLSNEGIIRHLGVSYNLSDEGIICQTGVRSVIWGYNLSFEGMICHLGV